MDNAKIILVCSKNSATEIKSILPAGFEVLFTTDSGNEALRKTSVIMPDVIITDFFLSDMNGLELSNKIEDLKICPCIILANSAQSDFIDELKNNDTIDIFCITKPVNRQVLIHTTELAVRLSHKIHSIEKKVAALESQIEERKHVDKARGLLMKKFNMDEATAYRHIQKKAMDSGKTINEIAETIIQLFEQ